MLSKPVGTVRRDGFRPRRQQKRFVALIIADKTFIHHRRIAHHPRADFRSKMSFRITQAILKFHSALCLIVQFFVHSTARAAINRNKIPTEFQSTFA
ncbi:hypothetical protein EDS67_28290 [candidate division KSB1 bacterium]|nr:MAG: hypothetical protein EDS67_28290 [candidate division KSB1 bacterium]MCE7945597.1 hypothetical protein [Chlorobi bacterium CHB1]